jgi:aminobenzoyl-glutamate transport protein
MNRFFNAALDAVERMGNRLPDPATLFVIMIALVVAAAWIAAAAGVSVVHPAEGDTIAARNLFEAGLLRRLFTEMPQTFAGFPPLGTVLVAMLGIGVADKSGLLNAALRSFVTRAPSWLLSAALVFVGIMSSLAADAGYVVLIPLGAVLFAAAGRHPLDGLAATFAGVSAGFSANLVLTALDPLLAGITQAAAQVVEPDYIVPVTANYYLMVALVPVLALTGAWLTDRLVEPRLRGLAVQSGVEPENTGLSAAERRGLYAAGAALLACLIVITLMVVPGDAVLRGEDGGLKPFYASLVALMFLVFFVCGLAYGLAARRIHSDRDVVNMTAESMSDMGHYIVLAFLAAHFIALFKWSNLGLITAVSGARGLEALGFTGPALLMIFIAVAGLINLLVGSASAKWALIAPVFVPMMMLLGYPPELTQAAYRIGDSATNILTPLMPYFPLVIVFARRYVPDLGIGTLIAMMLPYSVVFGLSGSALLLAWMLFGWPLGPG